MSSPTLRRACCCLFALTIFSCVSAFAQSTGGRILGKVSDSTGAVVNGVQVKLTNVATGVARETNTTQTGDYTFIEVVPGNYQVEYTLQGFKRNVRENVTVEVNQVLTLNATLQPGGTQETVEVTSEAPLVDTTSTQLGAVVDDRSVSQLPLNARDTYQFLQLQPGVMSTVGSSASLYYGSDNAGAVSVNGGRGRANNFSVNGGDANDQFVNLPTVQPTPDSIQEFRVLTNTFDAEYGRNSGSVVNVITKSGTNAVHGDVYEFFRNTVLNAGDFCFSSPLPCSKPQFNQNQFGGTLGGPIKKDRTFFFASYEGRRIRQGITSGKVSVLSAQEAPGPNNVVNGHIVSDFGDLGAPFGGALSNPNVLLGRNGCQAALTDIGEGAIDPNATSANPQNYSDIFTNNQIPLECMDPTAVDVLQFVPTPATGNAIQTVPVQPDRGDQFTTKIDHRINEHQNLSFYYYFDDHRTTAPFANFQLAGADVPGFGSIVAERFQQWNITHTWSISNSTVNEFRFNYNREAQRTFQHPQRTSLVQDSCPTPPAWLTAPVPCFNDGQPGNPTGIHPGLGPDREGLPFIQISGAFNLGNNAEGELPQVGNSFQWSDSVTKVSGNHTFKFGGDIRRQRFDQTLYFDVSGEYFYFGGGPNDVGAVDSLGNSNLLPNYLLGLPDEFGQGSAQVENVRSTSTYLFAQDSWKIRRNVTLNYGLRWELNTPIADISRHVQTFRPGQVSSVYPCGGPNTDCTSMEPVGLVVAGDKGVPTGLTQTYYKSFAPRIGIAWSPGTSGKTSVRAGWGLFYNPIEQLVLEQFSAEPPFGGSSFPVNTQFNQPFLGQDGVTQFPNPFNGILNAPRGKPVDWGIFRPILLFGQFQPNMRSQYSAQYNFGIQRELAKDMKLQVGYVGSQAHRLLATHDLNYGNPQTCLDIANIAASPGGNVTDGFGNATSCGQFLEDSPYVVQVPGGFPFHMPSGAVVQGTGQTLSFVGLRKYSSPQCSATTGWSLANGFQNGCPADGVPVFSSVFAQDTIANSAYNSLQASLEKRFAHGLQFTAAYTFSKSFDDASSFEGILNPIDPRLSRALSLFDARHRFVLSYFWQVPTPKFSGFKEKALDGWSLSGITTFQTGFPIRITSQADNELMNSFDFELPGEPDQIGPFHTQKPQNNNYYYFNPSAFTEDATADPTLFGRIGNAPRTICCGPRISNTDFAVLKNIQLNETRYFEFRAEFFNLFNHTQFLNPDGDTTDGAQFGQVTRARDPRLVQFALKFFF